MEDPSIKVLVIDDEPGLLDIAKQFLELDRTISVDTSLSAADALKLIERREYGVIVSDYQMPKKDGIQLLKEIRGMGNKTPFILFTGKGREEVAIEALNNGANFYLQKGGQSASQFAELANMIKQAYISKLGERALRISEERYRILFENSVDAVMLATKNFESVLSANPSACKMFGMTEDEIRTTGIKGLIIDNKEWENVVQRLNQTGISKGKFTYRRKDGTTFTGETTHGILTGHYGIARISMIVRDITENKLTDGAIRESEERLRTYIDNAPEGIFIVDALGNYLDVNATACSMLKYSREELLNLDINGIMCRNAGQRALSRFQQLKEKGKVVMETVLIRKDGIEIPIFLNAVELPDQRYMAFCTDITEHKRAVDALKVSEERYRQLVESAAESIVVIQDGLLRMVNRMAIKVIGYPEKELLSESFCSFVHPDDRSMVVENYQRRTMDETVPARYELRLLTREGSTKWFEISAVLIDWEGRPATLNFLMDITERKRAEEAMRNTQAQLRVAMDLAKLVHWEYDVDKDRFTFDDQFYALYGSNVHKEGGQLMSSGAYAKRFIPPDEAGIVSIETAKAISTTDPNYVGNVTHTIIKSDGERRILNVRFGVVKDMSGRTVKTFGANQDVTELKRAEEALREANKKLNLLSSITRHDIKNQLMTLDGNLTMLSLKELDPASEELLRKSNSALNRISTMIKFTKEYEDIGVKDPVWCDIRTTIEKEAKGIALGSIKLVNDVPINLDIYADPLIAKVFHNLFDNAVRHGGKITTIHFFVEEHEGPHAIICEDDGVGIPSKMKEELFTHGSGKSHGFGLFLSREILGITGITMKENGEPEKGARFEITVPATVWRSSRID
jgi:PAS domain S-box-containing protein